MHHPGQAEQHRLGYVARGLGATFRASVRAITAERRISEIRHFGDLAFSGVRMPLKASHTASQLGLPAVQPTEVLYGTLLGLGRPRIAKETSVDVARLAGWLPAHHQADTMCLLVEGKRLAQEWVGYRHLKRSADWYTDIR